MYSLARELGMTVGELAGRMSGQELLYWQALYGIEERERGERRAEADIARHTQQLARGR